jgi:glucuronoarabinoxylan endo-1,4-beta-xylanase
VNWRTVTILLVASVVGSVLVVLFILRPSPETIAINWGTQLQKIDGFGAASAGNVTTLSSSLMDFFYTNTGSNIGLDWIRLQIYPDAAGCATDQGMPSDCVTVSSGPTVTVFDLANARAAVARGAKVIATEWSPPGSMKSTGVFYGPGNFLGNPTNYSTLASIQAQFVLLLAGYGVPVDVISPQNEPDISTSYQSCVWTAQQFHDYIPYLSSALATVGSKTQIAIPEMSGWNFSDATTTFNDATVAGLVGIIAAHDYSGTAGPTGLSNVISQHVWQTEVSDQNRYDGSMTSALRYATGIHHNLTAGSVNAWFYWLLSGVEDYTDNEALTDSTGNHIATRAYAIGNWSKFVRPGWYRVDVTNGTSLLVSAFRNANGSQGAIVVVNNSSFPATRQSFAVGTISATVVPWITSSTRNLKQQGQITVTSGSFSYTIPGASVVTFSTLPSALTGATATVPQ